MSFDFLTTLLYINSTIIQLAMFDQWFFGINGIPKNLDNFFPYKFKFFKLKTPLFSNGIDY
jgi:hypothetical protein